MNLANRTFDRFPPAAILAALVIAALLLAPAIAQGDSTSSTSPPAQYRGPAGDVSTRGSPLLEGAPSASAYTYSEGLVRWEFWFEHEKDALLRAVLERPDAGGLTEPPGAPVPAPAPLDTLRPADLEERVLPALRAALRDDDAPVRAAAALALGEAHDLVSLPRLAGMLRTAPAPERRTAALALGFLGGPDAADALLRALEGDPDEGVRATAAVSLGLSGHAPAGAMLRGDLARNSEATGREAKEHRVALVTGLGLLRDREAVPLLQEILLAKDLRDDRSRAHAASALGRIGDPAAVPPLLRALRDADAGVRRSAALALGALPDPGAAVELRRTVLEGRDSLERGYAAISLARSAGPAAVPALAAYTTAKYDRYARGFAAVALGLTGAPREAAPPLRALLALRSEDSVRGAAAVGLGLLGDRASAQELYRVHREKSSSPELRGYALLGLAMIGDPSAETAVRAALAGDEHPDVQRAAALAAGLRPFPGSGGAVLRVLLEARDPTVRGASLLALGLAPDRTAVPTLADLAKDASAPTLARVQACAALGQLCMDGGLPPVARIAAGADFRSLTPDLARAIRVF